jgi:DNA polymerase-3 subunit delta'
MTTFDDIIGQADAVEWIALAYLSDRLPHGLIFAGPSGVGKATTARALAGLFLCERPKGAKACGACESCRVFEAGNHPDYSVVYRQLVRILLDNEEIKAKDLSIHVVREYVVAPANRKPLMGRGRVFIVEEAETMNAAAQNSLLKTLEEPYGRTLIVLLTDQPDALLATIRSRAQTVRFHSLDEGVVTKELARRGIDPATARQAAELAEGSLGMAIKWIEDGVVEQAQQLHKRLDELLAGRGGTADLAEWFKQASEAYAAKQVERDKNTSLDQAKREGISLNLRLAGQRFRRVLRESSDAAALDQACTAIEVIARADDYLEANVNIPLVLQQLSMELGHVRAA